VKSRTPARSIVAQRQARPRPAPSSRTIFKRKKNPCCCACDTFRAAAIDRSNCGARASRSNHRRSTRGRGVRRARRRTTAQARQRLLFIDTAGRFDTKHNLMQELQKLHRVIAATRGAPHEYCWLTDDGMNALNQAREFNKLFRSPVVVTNSTARVKRVCGDQKELGCPSNSSAASTGRLQPSTPNIPSVVWE